VRSSASSKSNTDNRYSNITCYRQLHLPPVRPDSIATADQWQQRLGRTGPKALAHLPTSVTGAKVTNGPPTVQCEAYSTSKAHKLISRRPAPRATTPFNRVHLNLIQMTEGFNGDKWFLHFLDDTTRMNFVHTFPTKSFLTVTIQQFTRRIFGFEIKIFHSDNERTFGKRFDTWIKQEGDTFESPAHIHLNRMEQQKDQEE
jgi:hypothetical protein